MEQLSSIAVANWFIDKTFEEKKDISVLKLHRLLFLAHGWCLAIYNRPLVDECVEAVHLSSVVVVPQFLSVKRAALLCASAVLISERLPEVEFNGISYGRSPGVAPLVSAGGPAYSTS